MEEGGGCIAYLRFHWGILNKLQGKVVTQSAKLEWWIISMVNCVAILHGGERYNQLSCFEMIWKGHFMEKEFIIVQ